MKDTFKAIEKLYDRKELVTGVPTGFTDLDTMTAGLQGGDLLIVAGRPSMGKTAFCSQPGRACRRTQPKNPSRPSSSLWR